MVFTFDKVDDVEERNILEEVYSVFKTMHPQDIVFSTHYELEAHTNLSADKWRVFLQYPPVKAWLNEEVEAITGAKYRKMIAQSTNNERSVGAAQMLNALNKTMDKGDGGAGISAFVYTYVPLSDNQKKDDGSQIELEETLWTN